MPGNKNKENCEIIHQDITVSTFNFKIVPNLHVNKYCIFNYNHKFYMNICDFYDLCGESYHFTNIKGKSILFPDIIICTDATRRNVYISLHGCKILAEYSDRYKAPYNLFNDAIQSINIKEDEAMVSIICNIIGGELNNMVKEDVIKKIASKIIAAYSSIIDTDADKTNDLIKKTDELTKKIDELYDFAHANDKNILQDKVEEIKEENESNDTKNIEQECLHDNNDYDTSSEVVTFSMFDDDSESKQAVQAQVVNQSVICPPVINITDQSLKKLSDVLLKMYSNKVKINCEDFRIKTYKLFGYFLGKGDLVAQRKQYEEEHGKIQIIDYYCVMNHIPDYLLMLLGETRNNRNIYTDNYNGKTVMDEVYEECTRFAIKDVFGLQTTEENREEVMKKIRLKSSYYPQA